MQASLQKYWPGWEIVRFGITGVLATATHYLVLSTLVELAGVSPTLANGAAFCVAVGVTYAGQSLWVFKVRSHGLMQVQKFLLTAMGGLLANMGLMALLNRGIGMDYRIAFVIILFVVPLGTYLINKFWVFAEAALDPGEK